MRMVSALRAHNYEPGIFACRLTVKCLGLKSLKVSPE